MLVLATRETIKKQVHTLKAKNRIASCSKLGRNTAFDVKFIII